MVPADTHDASGRCSRTGRLSAMAIILLACSVLAFVAPVAGQTPAKGATRTVEVKGIVKAVRTRDIGPRFSGSIEKILFSPGQFVEKGALLFEMDDIVQRNEQIRDNARLRHAKARLRQAEYNLANSQSLRKRDVASERQLFDAEIARDLAEADFAAADIQAYAADLTVKEMKIYAPFSGIMGRPTISEGTSINKEARENTTLVTITQLDPIQVIAHVPYDIYASRREILKTDAQADQRLEFSLILPDGGTFPHKGRLVAGGYAFDAQTQKIEIVVEFPNPTYLLRPGLEVMLQTDIEASDATSPKR